MAYLLTLVLVLATLYFAVKLGLRTLVARVKRSPAYQAEMAKLAASYDAEESVREEADWIGTTGLNEDIERELPKYLRREFGEQLLDEASLKAKDLTYCGVFEEAGSGIHYWNLQKNDGTPTYAYVEVQPSGATSTGWGSREPPSHQRASRTTGQKQRLS